MYYLKSGEQVTDRHKSHTHDGVQKYLQAALGQIESKSRNFFIETVEFPEDIGYTTCIPVDPKKDEIIYAIRKNRKGPTAFVKNKKPIPTNKLTIILKKIGNEKYIIISSWIGGKGEPEPWDKNATENSAKFWSEHALIWGSEELERINQCCVCMAIKQPDGTWKEYDKKLFCSHGYCPICKKKAIEEFKHIKSPKKDG